MSWSTRAYGEDRATRLLDRCDSSVGPRPTSGESPPSPGLVRRLVDEAGMQAGKLPGARPSRVKPPRQPARRTRRIPAVLVIASGDRSLPGLVAEAAQGRWRVESCSDLSACRERLSQPNLRLVSIDDAAVPSNQRGWLVEQIRTFAPRAYVVYVAQDHSEETEKRARSFGVSHYTSKPVEAGRFIRLLRAFLEPPPG